MVNFLALQFTCCDDAMLSFLIYIKKIVRQRMGQIFLSHSLPASASLLIFNSYIAKNLGELSNEEKCYGICLRRAWQL